jgi:hypothetical protein
MRQWEKKTKRRRECSAVKMKENIAFDRFCTQGDAGLDGYGGGCDDGRWDHGKRLVICDIKEISFTWQRKRLQRQSLRSL